MSAELLKILCCPVTKVPVRELNESQLAALNEAIAAGTVKHADGTPVEGPLAEGLVTSDGVMVYAVDEGIPVMLPGLGIATAQVRGWSGEG
ncbi:MAG: hypothetical protein OXN96_07035 [Bryobacterales bacterium]|nr:hypothetical protein [Bryobacterales bacterium]MDE0621207.1 hypothetical protein [Bryobacterales bacterium]